MGECYKTCASPVPSNSCSKLKPNRELKSQLWHCCLKKQFRVCSTILVLGYNEIQGAIFQVTRSCVSFCFQIEIWVCNNFPYKSCQKKKKEKKNSWHFCIVFAICEQKYCVTTNSPVLCTTLAGSFFFLWKYCHCFPIIIILNPQMTVLVYQSSVQKRCCVQIWQRGTVLSQWQRCPHAHLHPGNDGRYRRTEHEGMGQEWPCAGCAFFCQFRAI